MDNANQFERSIANNWPVEQWRNRTVLVAVSGGADSVALLRVLACLHREHGGACGRLVVAHFNHCWRGAESDGDADFVRRLARQLSLAAVIGRARLKRRSATESASSKRDENSARTLRYRFLSDVAGRYGARYVVTGHTADDQVETILQRVLRGTGLSGLAGIPRIRRLTTATTLLRPMLHSTRAEVAAYLESLGQPFREDSSNFEQVFVRNRIRRELLPLAREIYPGVDGAVQRLGNLAGQAHRVLERQAVGFLERLVIEQLPNCVTLQRSEFTHAEAYLVQEALRLLWRQLHWPSRAMGLDEWGALAEMLGSELETPPRARTFPGGVCAKKEGETLSLTRPAKSVSTADAT